MGHRYKFKKGNIPWNKGKSGYKLPPFSDKHKRKISENHSRHNLNKKMSEETKKKISKKNKGHLVSTETRKNISMNSIGKRTKEKSYQWIKDRTKLKKSEKKHLDGQYREWMFSIKNRDGWKCRLFNDDCSGRLESHHIFNWIEYPELRYILTNGITLCAFHHPRGREEEKRMIPIFQELLSVLKE